MGCAPSSSKDDDEVSNSDDREDGELTASARQTAIPSSNSFGYNYKMLPQQEIKNPQGNGGGNNGQSAGDSIRFGPMTIYKYQQIKVLCVFPKEDSLYTGISAGFEKLKWSWSSVKALKRGSDGETTLSSSVFIGANQYRSSTGSAVGARTSLSAMTSPGNIPNSIDILIIDYRQQKLLLPNTLEIIKELKEEKSVQVVIAIVKKSFYEKGGSEELNNLLTAGIDKVVIDHGINSVSFWTCELTQIERSLVRDSHKFNAAQSLFAALDYSRDIIQITDAQNRIQFVNKSYEKVLGFASSEVCGLDFLEVQNRINSQFLSSQTQTQKDVQQEKEKSKEPPAVKDKDVQIQTQGQITEVILTDSTPTSTTQPQPLHKSISKGDYSSMTSPQPLATTPSSGNPPPLHLSSPPTPFHEHVAEELAQGKEWEGNYMFVRKSGDPIFLNSRVLPFSSKSNFLFLQGFPPTNPPPPISNTEISHNRAKNAPATHYIYISEVPSSFIEKSFSSDITSNHDAGYPMPRGSLKSLRKASYDIKSISNDSSILRRQSLAKLHSLTIEAPITKVINIIAAAQQNCPLYVAQALEKVLEILRTTELYSPQFFDPGNKVRSDDPLTTDLLGALLSQGPKPVTAGRRSSNENMGNRLVPRPSLPNIAEAPSNIQKLLESEAQWDFDIILLEEITEKRPLVWLGMAIFSRFGVCATLNTDETTLRNWLTLIEANYHASNSYHNSTHAADVLQATAYFLATERLKSFMDPIDEAISLVAAVVHDVDHPGKNSAFMCNSGNELALLYNDLVVLESHHAAFTFKLTLSDSRVNIFKNLDVDTYRAVRKSIIDMVLATEMTRHFEHLSKFLNVFSKPFIKEDVDHSPMPSAGESSNITIPLTPTEPDISTMITPENIVLIKRMLIKCADVGNPARPLKLCVEWAQRIAEEYFRQTEAEIGLGLSPVMPMFDRSSCSIPKSQTGFVDYFVAAFIDCPEVIEYMKHNYDFWKDLDKLSIRSCQDVEKYMASNSSSSGSKRDSKKSIQEQAIEEQEQSNH